MPQRIIIAGETFEYYERQEWGSRNTSRPFDTLSDGPEPQGYLHHAGSSDNRPTILRLLTIEEEKAKMREWQAYCIDRANQGWSDIPYNIGVFPFSGRVYEARGWRYKSGATAGQNEDSKAVCLLGNNVPLAQGYSIAENNAALVFVWGVILGELVRTPQIRGHRENPKYPNATTCPGDVDLNVFRAMFNDKLARHFNPPKPNPIPNPPEDEDLKTLVLKKFKGYANVWLVGGGTATYMTPEDYNYYCSLGVPVIESERHVVALKSILIQTGLTLSDLTPD